jgi:hypothetical protein
VEEFCFALYVYRRRAELMTSTLRGITAISEYGFDILIVMMISYKYNIFFFILVLKINLCGNC